MELLQKKHKFVDSSDEFQRELKRHCSKAVGDDKYKELVAEQVRSRRESYNGFNAIASSPFFSKVDRLRQEREERQRAGAPTPPSPAPPSDPADNRHVLQPVERGDDNPGTANTS